jgi:hypothetical protein
MSSLHRRHPAVHPKQREPALRRLLQFVLLIAVLLSGTGLSASAMPCCASHSQPVKAAASIAMQTADAGVPHGKMHCHHTAPRTDRAAASERHVAPAAMIDCHVSVCMMRRSASSFTLLREDDGTATSATAPIQVARLYLPPALQSALLFPRPLQIDPAPGNSTLPLRI